MKKLIIACMCAFYSLLPAVSAWDLLDSAIEPSKANGQVLDLWNNKESVWNTVFKRAIGLGWIQQPLYVRIIKVILRLTLILWVTVGIILGIKYIFDQWDSAKQKKTIEYITNIVYWILIALSALVIVELIQSVTRSSIVF
jgi:hypothetical protein